MFKTPEVTLHKVAELIHGKSGINFPPSHLKVLDQRIQKVIKEKEMTLQEFYSDLLLDSGKLFEFIGIVTTNHTHFFRNIDHFHALGDTIIPALLEANELTKHISIWSCASSSGEEPYTLLLYLHHYFEVHNLQDWSFSILATDIDQTSLATAEKGIYPIAVLSSIPKEYHEYLTIDEHTVEIPTKLKKNIRFALHNLMDTHRNSLIDILFCRNVLIYFNDATQEKVIEKLVKGLKPNRYFFISSSESITGIKSDLTPVILPKVIYYTNKK